MKTTTKLKIDLSTDENAKIKQITHVYAFSEKFISGEDIPLDEIYKKYNLAQYGLEPIESINKSGKKPSGDLVSFIKRSFLFRLLKLFYDGLANTFSHGKYFFKI